MTDYTVLVEHHSFLFSVIHVRLLLKIVSDRVDSLFCHPLRSIVVGDAFRWMRGTRMICSHGAARIMIHCEQHPCAERWWNRGVTAARRSDSIGTTCMHIFVVPVIRRWFFPFGFSSLCPGSGTQCQQQGGESHSLGIKVSFFFYNSVATDTL